MGNQNSGGARRVSRQSWKPNRFLVILRGLWSFVYALLKIAVGAAATVAVITVICLFCFVGILADYLETDILPNSEVQLEGFDQSGNSYVYYVDSNGDIQVLQKLYAETSSDWASYDEIPEAMIQAAVAIEDKRFFEHQGVDWFTTIKACINMFVGSGSQFGGSSITQQLIKNLYLEYDDSADDVTVQRKVQEIFRATEFEKRYDKTVVLEWYLNKIYLGENCTGVKAAAATYFGKELEDLTVAECACIISITNNPSRYDPYRETLDSDGLTGLEENRIRQVNTLYEMRNQGWLTEEEYWEAYNQELVFKRGIDDDDEYVDCKNEECGYHGHRSTYLLEDGVYYCPQCGEPTTASGDASQTVYSWFVDTVLEDVAQMLCEQAGLEWNSTTKEDFKRLASQSGYHIYSTLDMTVQNAVDAIYTDLTQIPETQSLQQLQSAIVIIDNTTGDIVAMAGGVGEKTVHDAYNCATDATLQPGSAIKPLSVYAPAFELGAITPASVIDDLPLYYVDETPFPRNDTKTYSYSRTVLDGLVSSVNAVAVNTLDKIGLEYSFRFARDKFGLSTLVESYTSSNGTVYSDIGWSPLGMGAPTFGVTVRDMASAYATFANDGVYREGRTFTKVYDSEGNLVLDNTQDSVQIISEKTVNYVNYCLDSAVDHGTGTLADLDDIGISVAGKTGTTMSRKDLWFCGYTGYYTAAVWSGYLTPEEIIQVGTSGNPSARLWNKVMEPLHESLSDISLYDSNAMVKVTVCLDCGKLATDACSMDVRTYDSGVSRTATAYVYPEDMPTEECDCHVIVDFCTSCNAVANDYCKLLAEAGQTTLVKRSLVKLTQTEVNAIAAAGEVGLSSAYLKDNYVYLVDKNGSPLYSYKGISGTVNSGVSAPYLVCTVHTQADWEAYLAQIGGTEGPADPTEESTDPTEETEEPSEDTGENTN